MRVFILLCAAVIHSFCGYIVCLVSILLLVGIWVASKFCLLGLIPLSHTWPCLLAHMYTHCCCMCTEEWTCWILGWVCMLHLSTYCKWFCEVMYQIILRSTVSKSSHSFMFANTWHCQPFKFTISKLYIAVVVLMCISVKTNKVGHLFVWFWIFFSFGKSLWESLAVFLQSYPFLTVCRPSSTLDGSPLLVLCCEYLFLPSVLCGTEMLNEFNILSFKEKF